MSYWTTKIGLSLFAIGMLVPLLSFSMGKTMSLHGKLIYGESDYIYELDLPSLKHRVVYKEKESSSIFVNLTKLDDKHLLFEDGPYHLIKELNLDTGAVNTVRSGYGPKYIPRHGKLFFYDKLPNKPRVGLFIADLENPVHSANVVHEGPFAIPRQVMQSSKDDVIFYQDRKLWKYNIVTGVLKEFSIKNCSLPLVMRSLTNQLLCFDASGQRYFLTDLKGENPEYIHGLEDAAAALYIPEHDTLVFSKARFQLFPPVGEVYDIWAYSFKDGRKIILQKNASVSLGSVIWVE